MYYISHYAVAQQNISCYSWINGRGPSGSRVDEGLALIAISEAGAGVGRRARRSSPRLRRRILDEPDVHGELVA